MARCLGELLAVGSRSEIRAWGHDAVAKVPLPATPEGWVRFEATYTEAVRLCGAPVPMVLDVVTIDGREVSISERIAGPSMWDAAKANPDDSASFGTELADLHVRILELVPPMTIPSQRSRLSCKIRAAARAVDPSVLEVLEMLPPSVGRVSLCHGDMHPKNIILGPDGPVVVDWFDVAGGDACGDVARTSLLLAGGDDPEGLLGHLPGASRPMLFDMHEAYLEAVTRRLELRRSDVATWRVIQAAARLSEGVDPRPLQKVLTDHFQAAKS